MLLCAQCRVQLSAGQPLDSTYWLCLNNSMWSQVPAVQAQAWRILSALTHVDWCREALEVLYLDDSTLEWAQQTTTESPAEPAHQDANGAALADGDRVILSKNLEVKGAGFTAKRGTLVRNISLVANNHRQIEGRVNGQRIVILSQFVKRAR